MPAHSTEKLHRLITRGLGRTLEAPLSPRPIWVHALSAGEVAAAEPLVEGLKARFPQIPIALSVTTRVGREVARKRLGHAAAGIFYLPLDHPLAVGRALGRVDPRVFVLVETDIWPVMLYMLRASRVPAVLVNARLSPTSAARYRLLGPLIRPVLGMFGKILAKSREDATRFLAAGLSPERVVAAGNLKFHILRPEDPEGEAARFFGPFGVDEGSTVWVAGSTHPGEEEVVLALYRELLDRWPSLYLIVAPRHPARATEVAAMAQRMGLSPVLRSRSLDTARGPAPRVGILDTMGELAALYSLADFALIGGSLARIGGHNPLEPAIREVPVAFGPHMFNFTDEARALVRGGGGIEVSGRAELGAAVSRWLEDADSRQRMGRAARSTVEAHRGALARCLDAIESLLPGP